MLPLLSGCNVTYAILDRITGNAPAKFAMFGRNDFRAGIRFAMLEHSATFESRVGYQCVDLWPGARQCTLPIHPGKLVAVVDDRGRVARLTVITAEPLLYGIAVQGKGEYENALTEMQAEWNKIRRADTLITKRKVELRWRDASGRSAATLWYSLAEVYGIARRRTEGSLSDLPDSVAVTDMRAYTELLANSPFKNGTPARSEIAAAAQSGSADPAPAAAVQSASEQPPPSVTPTDALSAMHSDLRALSIAQETFLREQGDYARKLGALHLMLSDGVNLELVSATGDGWAAVATHRSLPGASCVIYSGAVARIPRTQRSGVPAPAAGAIGCDPI